MEGTQNTDPWELVARRIIIRRGRLGKSQSEIPGVNRTTVSRVERGVPVGLDTLARVEAALGFDEGELVNMLFDKPQTGHQTPPEAATG